MSTGALPEVFQSKNLEPDEVKHLIKKGCLVPTTIFQCIYQTHLNKYRLRQFAKNEYVSEYRLQQFAKNGYVSECTLKCIKHFNPDNYKQVNLFEGKCQQFFKFAEELGSKLGKDVEL